MEEKQAARYMPGGAYHVLSMIKCEVRHSKLRVQSFIHMLVRLLS